MTELKTDKIFHVSGQIQPFEFNQNVAEVFDDMATRSIPFYAQVQQQMVALIQCLKPSFKNLYDVGCSTGSLLFAVAEQINDVQKTYVGFDLSQSMIDQCQKKKDLVHLQGQFDWHCVDMMSIDFSKADVVVLNYTLQFVSPERRLQFLKTMRQELPVGSVVFVSEKIKMSDESFQESFTDIYEQFKRGNKYSNLEIAQKRKALENVLVPLTRDENKEMFEEAGFKKVECFFRWFNFASFVLIKE